jgi:hypothetical protein
MRGDAAERQQPVLMIFVGSALGRPYLPRAARQAEAQRIREALDTLETADPMLLTEARAQRAVQVVPLMRDLRPPPGPSLGGLTAAQMEDYGVWSGCLRRRSQKQETNPIRPMTTTTTAAHIDHVIVGPQLANHIGIN